MKRFGILIIFALVTLILYSGVSFAHEFRPYLLDIREISAGRYTFSWSEGSSQGAAAPVFPTHCRIEQDLNGISPRVLDCSAAGLTGSVVAVEGLSQARVEAVVRYSTSDGSVMTGVLRAGSSTFRVPGGAAAPRSKPSIFLDYLASGVDHILRGWDHLLFVLGLLLLVKGALVHTITAFTLAHSFTLALAVTGAVHVPQAPAEALIALSLMLLAAEIARPAPSASIARRRPWAMALLFGLLHGFGFAGALAELGLPKGEIPLALAAFNIGVEIGQIAFVFAVLGIVWLARRMTSSASDRESPAVRPYTKWSPRVPAYAIGALAAFWLIERLMSLGS
ncbi:MAG TPA: HupE/UreJ family protein [Polyangiaceae bacterium]|nr:HupE/UreJ family protein [Polyangiaceae bacterium]